MVNNIWDEELLMMVSDIYYWMWDFKRAIKPAKFILSNDPDSIMWNYVSWILLMDTWQNRNALKHFDKVYELQEDEHPEILRVRWLCEYRVWKKQGIQKILSAFEINDKDAAVISNLIEIYSVELEVEECLKYIAHYEDNIDEMQFTMNSKRVYDEKISNCKSFIEKHIENGTERNISRITWWEGDEMWSLQEADK